MPNVFSQFCFSFAIIFIASLMASYFILHKIVKTNSKFINFLQVRAEKSPNQAFLLGGVSLTATSILFCLISLFFFANSFDNSEKFILTNSFLPICLITFYGYIDDRYEIRARHKLFLQLLSVSSFIIPFGHFAFNNNPYYYFYASIFGIAYINGCNLIDGIDTLFAKIAIITSIAFIFISIDVHSNVSILFSLMIIATMLSFYHFNREPARIYAGEIGGSLLGMLFFIQAHLLLAKSGVIITKSGSQDIYFKILIASLFPLCELGITFVRRVSFKQSPFRGDHLHIHHIIKSKFNLGPSKTANFIVVINVISIFIGLLILTKAVPKYAFSISCSSLLFMYSSICYRHWKKSYSSTKSNKLFFNFNPEHIDIIDSKLIDDFYLKYKKTNPTKLDKFVA